MASVDARDARGNTALHWAEMGGVEQEQPFTAKDKILKLAEISFWFSYRLSILS